MRRRPVGIRRLRGWPGRHPPGSSARRLGIALTRPLDAEEARWADRIEVLRTRVEQSRLEIPEKKSEPRTVGAAAKRASKTRKEAEHLMKVVRDFKPAYGVEMGTCVGVSAAYQAAAMALNRTGRLVSFEGYAVLSDVARANLAALGLEHIVDVRQGKFDALLPSTLREHPADYAFIDGHHMEGPTLEYFGAFATAAEGEVVLVVDDINWSGGMRRAWRQIREDDRTIVAVPVYGSMGFCIVSPHGDAVER